MISFNRFTGLVAATHTPFTAAGDLNVSVVERQAEHLLRNRVHTVFIGGTTGESHSLSLDERRTLATQWVQVARGSELKVIVHVGANCLRDARELASHAESLGVAAVAALAPSYFKPRGVTELIACCREIAQGAQKTPFYFYDIPSLTNVTFSSAELLARLGDGIPNLVGVKFTNSDLMAFQECLAVQAGKFDILWGIDEAYLAAVALGAQGAVGSTYNFAAKIYHDVWSAFQRNDFAAARMRQLDAVRLVKILVKRGYMASAKAMMEFLGVNVGPPRLPNSSLTAGERQELQAELAAAGYLN